MCPIHAPPQDCNRVLLAQTSSERDPGLYSRGATTERPWSSPRKISQLKQGAGLLDFKLNSAPPALLHAHHTHPTPEQNTPKTSRGSVQPQRIPPRTLDSPLAIPCEPQSISEYSQSVMECPRVSPECPTQAYPADSLACPTPDHPHR